MQPKSNWLEVTELNFSLRVRVGFARPSPPEYSHNCETPAGIRLERNKLLYYLPFDAIRATNIRFLASQMNRGYG
jgi:hypothetical protein